MDRDKDVCYFKCYCRTHRLKKKEIDLKTKLVNTKKLPSIDTKQITHQQRRNQTDMELRNRTVGLRQQVQHSHHAEIPIQNSQSHNKCNRLRVGNGIG